MPNSVDPTIVAAINVENTRPWGSPAAGTAAASAAAAVASSNAGVHKKVKV